MRILALTAALLLLPTASALLGPYWAGTGTVEVLVGGSRACSASGPVSLAALPSNIEPSEFLLVVETDCPTQALELHGRLTSDGYEFDDHVDGALVSGSLRHHPEAYDQWRLELDVSPCGLLVCAMPAGGIRIEAWLLPAIFA